MARRFGISSFALSLILGATALSCDYDVPVQGIEELKPMGVIQGQVLYSGPPPCTEKGHVVGAAVLYLFDSNGLPPPESLSPSVENFGVVAGDKLFADLLDTLPFSKDGSRVCPPPDAKPVTVSAPFTIAPVSAGSYQVRAFYDLDGDFFPSFSYSNLPSKGDIRGGSIENVGEFLSGKRAHYRDIIVGKADGKGRFVMPETGVRLENVQVTLGQPYQLQRPYTYYGEVIDNVYGTKSARHPSMPADYWPKDFGMEFDKQGKIPLEENLFRVKLFPGVPEDEKKAAMASPFHLHVDDPGKLMIYRYDTNGDGKIDSNDSVPETKLVPALMPMVLWTKTENADPTHSTSQAEPSVVIMGLTMAEGVLKTALFNATTPQPVDSVTVGVRPAVICISTKSGAPQITLVTPHERDRNGGYVLGEDTTALRGALAGMMGTSAENVDVVYACLPEGDYKMNVIYSSGQVWNLPNETGYCMPREEPSRPDGAGNPTVCGSRPRLASQGVALHIGPPKHGVEHCYEFKDPKKRQRYIETCLTAAEAKKFEAHTLY